ncbi:MAG: hypothetical protein AB7U18_15370, partial [Dehalococcoidia bacterium]
MADVSVRPGPKELLARMSPRIYDAAREKGMTLSMFLEREDPSSAYTGGAPGSGLDAFERLLQAAEIRTQGDPARGIYASEFGAFDANDATRALVPEWIARLQRRVAYQRPAATRAHSSDMQALGDTLHQYIFSGAAQVEQIAPQIPLSEIIATTTPIAGNAFKALQLTDNAADRRFVRVGERAELPVISLTFNDREVQLYKFGRAIEISYEAIRRLPIDTVALHVARVAVQMEIDKVTAALDIAVSGDGNAGTAATETEIATLDADAVDDVPTLRAWQAFKLLFQQPYMMTTALAPTDVALELLLMNSGSANVPMSMLPAQQFGSFTPINPQLGDGVRLGVTADAPAGKVIGIDRRFWLNHIVEIGSDVSETQRWVLRQVQYLTLSEVSGF